MLINSEPQSRNYLRYVTLVAGCFLSVISGTGYMLSAYAPELKRTMGYSQTEINLVGTIGMVMGYASSIVAGSFYDKFGGRITTLICTVFLLLGFFLMNRAADHSFWSNSLIMGLFLSFTLIGSSGSYTVALATNVKNFPTKHRGIVVGCLAGFYGLSAAIFTQIYQSTFSPNEVELFLFLAITLSSICFVAGMLVFLRPVTEQPTEELDPLIGDQKHARKMGHGLSLTPLQTLVNPEFILLYIVFFSITGPGLAVIGNLGSLADALGSTPKFQNTLVIILSIANFAGRALFGLLSDLTRKHLSRGFWMIVVQVLMAASQFLVAWSPLSMLPFAVVCVGLAYGGSWALVPTIVSELWGAKFFGTNFGLVCLAPALGSFVFSTLLSGKIYERHITDGGTVCTGDQCYRLTFQILGVVACVGLLFGYAFMRRSRSFYFATRDRFTADRYL